MGELIVRGPSPDRVIVGKIGRPRSLVAITELRADGGGRRAAHGQELGPGDPVAARARGPGGDDLGPDRRRRAHPRPPPSARRVWVWDPFGAHSDAWDLLQGCEDWEHALLVARWLGHARKVGEGINQDYFDQEAEGLVAPYLHAAALTPDITAAGVYHWILDRDVRHRRSASSTMSAPTTPRDRLKAVYSYTERQRDGIIGTAAVQLKAYGHPAAARTAQAGEGITPGGPLRRPQHALHRRRPRAPAAAGAAGGDDDLLALYWLSERENRTGAGL